MTAVTPGWGALDFFSSKEGRNFTLAGSLISPGTDDIDSEDPP